MHLCVLESVLTVHLHELFERELAQLDVRRGFVVGREVLFEIWGEVLRFVVMPMVLLALRTVLLSPLLYLLQLVAHFDGLFVQRMRIRLEIVLF